MDVRVVESSGNLELNGHPGVEGLVPAAVQPGK